MSRESALRLISAVQDLWTFVRPRFVNVKENLAQPPGAVWTEDVWTGDVWKPRMLTREEQARLTQLEGTVVGLLTIVKIPFEKPAEAPSGMAYTPTGIRYHLNYPDTMTIYFDQTWKMKMRALVAAAKAVADEESTGGLWMPVSKAHKLFCPDKPLSWLTREAPKQGVKIRNVSGRKHKKEVEIRSLIERRLRDEHLDADLTNEEIGRRVQEAKRQMGLDRPLD
jgi:hypothetical protein